MTTKVNNGVIDVLLDRSWDMGLSFIDQGKFESREELGDLFDEVYPWNVDDEEKSELVQELLDEGYIEPSPDADEIDCLQIVDDHLYAHYRDIEAMESFQCLIYDKGEWQESNLSVYDTLEDFAYYELTEGCYIDNNLVDQDYHSAPNPIDYIDLEALGEALVESGDESFIYRTEGDKVVTTDWGWS